MRFSSLFGCWLGQRLVLATNSSVPWYGWVWNKSIKCAWWRCMSECEGLHLVRWWGFVTCGVVVCPCYYEVSLSSVIFVPVMLSSVYLFYAFDWEYFCCFDINIIIYYFTLFVMIPGTTNAVLFVLFPVYCLLVSLNKHQLFTRRVLCSLLPPPVTHIYQLIIMQINVYDFVYVLCM